MKYRIRMVRLKWYVRIFNADGSEVGESGPYDKFDEAEDYAKGTGYKDWDKGA